MTAAARLLLASCAGALLLALAAAVPARAAAPIGDSLAVEQVSVSPPSNREGEAFTLSAWLTNHGTQALQGVVFYPAQPVATRGQPLAQIEVTGSSTIPLTLAPAQRAQVWVRFTVGSPGRHRLGLLVEAPGHSDGWVVAYDQGQHATAPTLLGDLRRHAGEVAAAALGAVALLVLAAAWSPARRLVPPLAWRPRPSDLAWMTGATLGLLTVLELSWLSSQAQAVGVPGAWFGWLLSVSIPARWLLPMGLAVALGLSRVPAVYGAVLFAAAHVIPAADLFSSQIGPALNACWPGVLLGMLLLAVRGWRRLPLVAPPAAVASALAYAEAAGPWFQLYGHTVLSAGH